MKDIQWVRRLLMLNPFKMILVFSILSKNRNKYIRCFSLMLQSCRYGYLLRPTKHGKEHKNTKRMYIYTILVVITLWGVS